MKYLLFAAMAFLSASTFAQRAILKDGVATYQDRTFKVGDTINIAYGSGTNGKFVFVSMGGMMTGVTPLESQFSKSQVKVDKVYKSGGRVFIRGKVLESHVNALGSNKVFIEPEGAIDKKEII